MTIAEVAQYEIWAFLNWGVKKRMQFFTNLSAADQLATAEKDTKEAAKRNEDGKN
ncbi:MAG: hypothetical protein GY820_01845 [Gammaproteobacteria bacterium]|nr:hypothetical protein [Gammaproteobacteria bacterium]